MDLERIIDQVSQTRKTRSICADTIRRLCLAEMKKYKSEKQVIKSVKSNLHQMHSAYVGQREHEQAGSLVEKITADLSSEANRELCHQLLQLHASTAERLDFYDDLYRRLFALTGQPQSILDVACGFNPFSLPWMYLAQPPEYLAADINTRSIELINRFFARSGTAGKAFLADALEENEFRQLRQVDLAYVFKLVPLLEKQEKGSSRKLIESLNARFVAVSFPIRSLSGRSLNMLEQNSELFEVHISPDLSFEKLMLDNELIYVIDKGG